MTSIGSRVSGPLGFQGLTKTVTCINGTGAPVTVGMVVAFDLEQNSGADNSVYGDDTSMFTVVRIPKTSLLAHGFYGVVMTAAAASAQCEVLLQGKVTANVTGTPGPGVDLAAANGSTNISITTAGLKVIAITTDTAAGGKGEVLFDGIYGFGHGV